MKAHSSLKPFKGIRILLLVVLLVSVVPPVFLHVTMVPPGELCLVGPDSCCSLLLAGAGNALSPCENHSKLAASATLSVQLQVVRYGSVCHSMLVFEAQTSLGSRS